MKSSKGRLLRRSKANSEGHGIIRTKDVFHDPCKRDRKELAELRFGRIMEAWQAAQKIGSSGGSLDGR